SGCRRPTEATALPPAVPAAPARTLVQTPAHRPRRVPQVPGLLAPAPDPASTLAEQNDLFAKAKAARRPGDRQSALEGFSEFVRPPGVVPFHRQRLHRGDPVRVSLSQRLAL